MPSTTELQAGFQATSDTYTLLPAMASECRHDCVAPSSEAAEVGTVSALTPNPKRRRLNFACNYCRSRKTRCDEGQPSCRACSQAGVPCITQDRRRPHNPVERRQVAATSTATHEGTTGTEPSNSTSSGTSLEAAANELSQHTGEPEADVSSDGPLSPALKVEQQLGEFEAGAQDASALPWWCNISSISCLDLLTRWLDLAVCRLGHHHQFLAGRHDTHQLTTALSPTTWLHSTPPPEACQDLLDCFLHNFNIVFPVLDPEEARQDVALLASSGPALYSQSRGVFSLLRACLILAAGAISCRAKNKWQVFVDNCLAMARQYLGQLVGSISTEAVQVLFLLSHCLKSGDELSSAMAIIDLCVSAARSIGLHRHSMSNLYGRAAVLRSRESRQRVWHAIYCYEKLLSFEIGRASSIEDDDSDVPTVLVRQGPADADTDLQSTILRLGVLLSRLGRKCIALRSEDQHVGDELLKSTVTRKMTAIGECALELTSWAETVPPAIRPTSELLCNAGNPAVAAYISIQYNLAWIILMRNSLLTSAEALRVSVTHVATGEPWEPIVRNGQTVAANSARHIIRLLTQLEEHNQTTFLPIYCAPLHAMYVLAAHCLRRPHARVVKADLELISDAAHFILHRVQDFVKKTLLSSSITESNTTIEETDFGMYQVPTIDLAAPLPDDLGWLAGLPDEIGCDWTDFAAYSVSNGAS
ncbi:proline utilization trans-activator [Microdochium nivale]|nr:proline utilization trans-activator [Microdochium nivale]